MELAAPLLYDLVLPRKVCFGRGVALRLPDVLPASSKRVLLLAGSHTVRSGLADQLAGLLKRSGREVLLIDGASSEPPPDEIDSLADRARSFRADSVAAVGGGSVIDAAKAAAALVPMEGRCMDYFSGSGVIDRPGLFFAAIPTTAGTGAEMTSNSVLTDPASKIKKSLRSPFMTPSAALNDPLLLDDAPAKIIAFCGLDAFVQAAECFTSTRGNPFSRALALSALKSLAVNLPAFYDDPKNETARDRTAEASMITGIAFAQTGLGAVHGLAHPAGALLHIPHGEACAILMPHVFGFNAEAVPEPYAAMAQALGIGSSASDLVRFTESLNRHFGIPEDLSSFGLKREHFPFLIKNCRSGSMKTNPRPMSDEQVETLLVKLTGKA